MPGLMRDTYCPKCRTTIVVSDITIDNEWTGSVKTMGTITLTRSGCLKEAELTAGDMIVEGDAEDGTINVCRTLELRKGARLNPARVTVNDIRIRSGCRLAPKVVLVCQTLHVEGHLKGEVQTVKTVTVHSGGMLQGKIHTSCLEVEHGGGLKAQLFIGRKEDG
jgi:cytoskeletal protein CcmA (bactofilin family)